MSGSNSFAYFTEKLDRAFSKWLRISNADSEGFVKCYTCTNCFHYTNMDCGHYRRRKHILTRWHEKNCKPQCKDCNQAKDGNLEVFEKNLQAEYGEGIIEELTVLSMKRHDFKIFDLKEKLKHYESQTVLR